MTVYSTAGYIMHTHQVLYDIRDIHNGRWVVYRSLPRVILLSHALNYKRVWRGGSKKLLVFMRR